MDQIRRFIPFSTGSADNITPGPMPEPPYIDGTKAKPFLTLPRLLTAQFFSISEEAMQTGHLLRFLHMVYIGNHVTQIA